MSKIAAIAATPSVALLCLLSGLVPLRAQSNSAPGQPVRSAGPPPVRFEDGGPSSGIDFVLRNSPTPEKHMIETMVGGVAVFDYNNDGLADIFFTNGAALPSLDKSAAKFHNRLYRNGGGLKFSDVTAAAGVAGMGYSMGAAAADIDNDGDIDLFVAGVFRNLLYRNNGQGKFEEIAAASGIQSDRWSVAAGWFDYDNDGLLDLMVINYADWDLSFNRYCGDRARNIRVYCHPKYFTPISNQLYRNLGNARFEDVTGKSGVGQHKGRGMSVAFEDYDNDGHIDAFVTNDNLPNFLFRNKGDGTFEEVGLLAGVALLDHGKPVASMGADFRDYDNDGFPDINVTALSGETFPLFHNEGDGFFRDATYKSGLAAAANPRAGWGNGIYDFNNDGWKDLFTANGHVNDLIQMFESGEYPQPNSIFLNQGDGTFEDSSAAAGKAFQTKRPHRGAGFADFDNDGRIDVVVTSLDAPTELWHNVSPGDAHWLRLNLVGAKSNRDGIGARILVDGQANIMTSAVGYASSSHQGVHFGLGVAATAKKIEIRWPDGSKQTLANVKANQVVEVREP